jgi:hypothetical protein
MALFWTNAILNSVQQLAAKACFMQQFSAAAAGGTLHFINLHFVGLMCRPQLLAELSSEASWLQPHAL